MIPGEEGSSMSEVMRRESTGVVEKKTGGHLAAELSEARVSPSSPGDLRLSGYLRLGDPGEL